MARDGRVHGAQEAALKRALDCTYVTFGDRLGGEVMEILQLGERDRGEVLVVCRQDDRPNWDGDYRFEPAKVLLLFFKLACFRLSLEVIH